MHSPGVPVISKIIAGCLFLCPDPECGLMWVGGLGKDLSSVEMGNIDDWVISVCVCEAANQ